MKKKTVSIMVAATMALSLFAGCGSSKDTATEDTSKTESTETTDESSENASAETTDESSRTTFTVGSMQNIRHTVIWMMTENTPDLIWNWHRRYVTKKAGNW